MGDLLSDVAANTVGGILAALCVAILGLLWRRARRQSPERDERKAIARVAVRERPPWLSAFRADFEAGDYTAALRILKEVKPSSPLQQAAVAYFRGRVLYHAGLFRDSIGPLQNSATSVLQSDRQLAALVLKALGDAYFAVGLYGRSETKYREAMRILREDRRWHEVVDARQDWGNLMAMRGHMPEANRAVALSFWYHLLTLRVWGAAYAAMDLAQLTLTMNRPAGGFLLAKFAVVFGQHEGRQRASLGGLTTLGSILKRLGRFEEAEAIHLTVLAAARQLGDLRYEAGALANLATIDLSRHRADDAELKADTAAKTFRRIGYRDHELRCRGIAANAASLRGDLNGAERKLRILAHEAERSGSLDTLKQTFLLLRSVMYHAGNGTDFDALRAEFVRRTPILASLVPTSGSVRDVPLNAPRVRY